MKIKVQIREIKMVRTLYKLKKIALQFSEFFVTANSNLAESNKRNRKDT